MTEKVLTLVIPSYNMEKYLDRCLSSLIVDDEHLKSFEALVINDGSKDRTSEIGHGYEQKYPDTFRVIDKENGHYGSCVNRGLAEARGAFIKVLDADDCFATEVFSSFLEFLMQKETKEMADLILSDYSIVDENGLVQRIHRYSDYSNPFSIDRITWKDREDWFIHGLTYRTSILHKIRYRQTEGISYTDEEWIVKPLVAVKTCYRFDGSLYRYTVGREGQSMSPAVFSKGLSMRITVAQSILDFYNSLNDPNSSVALFTKGRLLSLLNFIYHTTLFSRLTDDQAFCQLEALDEKIKGSSPDIYNELNRAITVAGIKFRPVQDFRNGKRFRLTTIRLLYTLSDSLNHIGHRK